VGTVGIALLLVAAQVAGAVDLTGRVIAIETGDTLKLATTENRQVTVRLSDIGAPVGSNFYAPSARQLLANMVQDETVRVAVTAEGGPDHVFGHVYRGLLDVNLELIKAGAAWFCQEFATNTEYVPYQNQALRDQRGLWSMTSPFDALIRCRQRPPAPKP
jgi:endonuclease YncB( thermonuclease family)